MSSNSRCYIHRYDSLIRVMAADGASDGAIAAEIGASDTGVKAYRLKRGIETSYHRTEDHGPREPERPGELRSALQEADALFGMLAGDKGFADIRRVQPIGRITGRTDPAIGMGGSSALTCAQAGEQPPRRRAENEP